MNSIIKCFSILVASERSDRCQDLRDVLHSNLLIQDKATRQYKVELFKEGSDQANDIGIELLREVAPLFGDVPSKFFLTDK